jgi:hypothetical protein
MKMKSKKLNKQTWQMMSGGLWISKLLLMIAWWWLKQTIRRTQCIIIWLIYKCSERTNHWIAICKTYKTSLFQRIINKHLESEGWQKVSKTFLFSTSMTLFTLMFVSETSDLRCRPLFLFLFFFFLNIAENNIENN